MFKDQTALAAYRLLEFPNETAQSRPMAKGERADLPIRLIAVVRLPFAPDAGSGRAKKVAA